MSELTVAQPQNRTLVKASDELSHFLGMEKGAMIDAIKAQCFKGKTPDQVSDAQLATYVSVANALKLNPLLPGMMYPYPDRNGSVTVMIGPDGVFKLLSDNPDIVAQKDGGPAWWTEHGKDETGKETCTAYINHRVKGLFKKTIWVDEWVVSSNPNWAARRHHQSEIRALKQAARMVVHGIPYDQEEATMAGEINVTPEVVQANVTVEEPPARAAAPKRNPKGAAAVVENAAKVVEAQVVEEKPKVETKPEPKAEAPKPEPKVVEPVVEQKPEPKPEPKVDPKPAEAPPAATEQPTRAMLKDGEVITVKATVASLTTLLINQKDSAGNPVQTPSIQCKLSGGFIGTVIHIGGGSARDGNTEDLVANPPWRNGASVSVTLRGRLQPKTGKVVVLVESVKAAEAVAATDLE